MISLYEMNQKYRFLITASVTGLEVNSNKTTTNKHRPQIKFTQYLIPSSSRTQNKRTNIRRSLSDSLWSCLLWRASGRLFSGFITRSSGHKQKWRALRQRHSRCLLLLSRDLSPRGTSVILRHFITTYMDNSTCYYITSVPNLYHFPKINVDSCSM